MSVGLKGIRQHLVRFYRQSVISTASTSHANPPVHAVSIVLLQEKERERKPYQVFGRPNLTVSGLTAFLLHWGSGPQLPVLLECFEAEV